MILLNDKRPSTSSLSSIQSDLVRKESRKKLVKKKRVVIGQSEKAICNEAARIQEEQPEATTAKLHPRLAENRQGLILIPI